MTARELAEECFDFVDDHESRIVRAAKLIKAFEQTAREEEREACCRDMCGPCADGRRVICGVLWYHPTEKGRGAQVCVCQAAAIRARGEAK